MSDPFIGGGAPRVNIVHISIHGNIESVCNLCTSLESFSHEKCFVYVDGFLLNVTGSPGASKSKKM
ncbi:hypothetical protein AKJ16_DCAP03939 [Drosera capensis]